MAELKGSKTEKNLKEAFAGESQARNKYTFFASQAKKDGYEQIADFFMKTAEEEKEHAKLHAKALGILGDTLANLKAASAGEGAEASDMYPRMAKEAREEGFDEIARVFDGIGKIEKEHQARYQKFLANIESGLAFQRPEKVKWHCRECGFSFEGTKAPEKCPVCGHPKSYFEINPANF